MRELEAEAMASGTGSAELMRRAGEGIFREAEWREPVAVVCGKGNNAGDGYVAALCMQEAGISCTVFTLSDSFSEDGRYYYEKCLGRGIPAGRFAPGDSFEGYGSVLDCIFGTGFRGEAAGIERAAIEAVNASGAYVVSADINSGINGDTGEGSVFVRSDLTVAVGLLKKGMLAGHGPEAAARVVITDIGLRSP